VSRRRTAAAVTLVACAAIYLGNASWLRGAGGRTTILAHRGMAQDFDRAGLDQKTCTAARMLPPTHEYLENTLPSMAAAFARGADVVELDIHPTSDGDGDGDIVVFHDWTLDCRTDGHGVTREQPLAYLKSLDIGHGYTADGGRSFPFRGRFVGAMPTLAEVLDAFPERRFLVNVKGAQAAEADTIAAYLERRRLDPERLMFYGGDAPIAGLRAHFPGVKTVSKPRLKSCLKRYLATGWLGVVPEACRDAVIFVPINYRYVLWGWPNLFVERMARANSAVYVIGPLRADTDTAGSTSIDTLEDLARLPADYAGGVSTDKIEIIAPAVKRRQ